jgi:hypothetical protein
MFHASSQFVPTHDPDEADDGDGEDRGGDEASLPNPATVRDIQFGRDTKLSSVEAIASALGLTLDLVEAE